MKKVNVEVTPTQEELNLEQDVMNETGVQEETQENELETEVLLQEIAELKDKNLRLMAEFDNFRKRSTKERLDIIKYSGEDVLKSILPIIDDFERGLKSMETAVDLQAVKEGVELIYAKFISYLSENGVAMIPTTNETFDTDLHEAITTYPAPSEDMKGKIIDCVSRGYTLNDKVIRYAKVVVGE